MWAQGDAERRAHRSHFRSIGSGDSSDKLRKFEKQEKLDKLDKLERLEMMDGSDRVKHLEAQMLSQMESKMVDLFMEDQEVEITRRDY